MAKKIEENIVSLELDNTKFEKNASKSMKTLTSLNEKLMFKDGVKGFGNVQKESEKVNFSPFTKAIDTVNVKVSAMEVAMITTFTNITNSALNAGKNITNALTIQPLTTGFQEYELKMGSIQTIMASTGDDLETVNGKLAELNTYSDKTIYSFKDMTQNIGKFTNSGVSLDQSVAAIQGIANVAAVSGANSEEASRSMYNFAQALSSGSVRLQDWKSIELANMATVEFKEQLLESAVATGSLTKEADGLYKTLDGNLLSATQGFNDSLADEWMTTEALVKTLGDYADETTEIGKKAFAAATEIKTITQLYDTLKESAGSGWATTWEIIVGDLQEAKALLTEFGNAFSDIIGASADKRNLLLQGWSDLGGRDELIQSLREIGGLITSITKPINEAFRNIFPETTAEQLLAITTGFKEFIKSFQLTEVQANQLKNTMEVLFRILSIGMKGFMIVASLAIEAFRILFNVFLTLGDTLSLFLGPATSVADSFIDMYTNANVLGDGLATISRTITGLLNGFKNIIVDFGEFVMSLIAPARSLETFNEELTQTESILSTLGNVFKPVINVFTMLMDIIVGLGARVLGIFDRMTSDDFTNAILTGGIFVFGIKIISILSNLGSVADTVASTFVQAMQIITSNIQNVLEGVGDSLEAFQNQLKSKTLLNIAYAVGILALSLTLLSQVPMEDLIPALAALSVVLGGLMLAMTGLSNLEFKSNEGMFSFTSALGNFEKITDNAQLMQMGVMLVLLASSIAILSSALVKMSSISWDELSRGITGFTVVLVGMLLMVKALGKVENDINKLSRSLIALSISIILITTSFTNLSNLSWEELAKGMTGFSVMMFAIIRMLNAIKGEEIVRAAGTLIALAIAVNLLVTALKNIGSLPTDELSKGLISLGVILLGMIIFMERMNQLTETINTTGKNKSFSGKSDIGFLKTAASLLILAVAINTLVSAVKKLGQLSWEELIKGLSALVVILLAMGETAKRSQGASMAMAIFIKSMDSLASFLERIAKMSITDIVKGLITMALSLGVVTGAMVLLSNFAGPGLLTLSVAFIGFSVGLNLTALALITTSVAINVFVAALFTLSAGIRANLTVLIDAIPMIIKGVAMGLVASIESMIILLRALLTAVIVLIVEFVPMIARALVDLIVEALWIVVDYTPELIDILGTFIVAIFDGLAKIIPDVIKSFMNFLGAVFEGVIKAFDEIGAEKMVQILASVGLMVALVAALSAIVSMIPMAMVGVLGLGLIITELAFVMSAIGMLEQQLGLSSFIQSGGAILLSLGTAIGSFVGGLVGGIAKGVMAVLPSIGIYLSEFMINLDPFLLGVSKMQGFDFGPLFALIGAVAALGAVSFINSMLSFLSMGNVTKKFSEDIIILGTGILEFSNLVANVKMDNVSVAANGIAMLIESLANLPTTGGLAGMLFGGQDIKKFANGLVALGIGLGLFSDAINGKIDIGSVKDAAESSKIMIETLSKIPSSGGFLSLIFGNTNITKFARDMVAFGGAIVGLSNSLTSDGKIVNHEAIKKAAESSKIMIETLSQIPNSGGFLSTIFGNSDIKHFANGMVHFGRGIVAFSNTLSEDPINYSAISSATKAGKYLIETFKDIPKSGGLFSIFDGSQNLVKFRYDMEWFGAGIVAFNDSIANKTLNVDTIKNAADAGSVLADSLGHVPKMGGFAMLFDGITLLPKFKSDIKIFGESIVEFATATASVTQEQLDKTKLAAEIGNAMITGFNNVPKTDSFWDFFSGADLETFKSDVVKYGDAITGFATATAGISSETIDTVRRAADIGNILVQGLAETDKIGGFDDWFAGVQDLEQFAKDLGQYGKAIVEFSKVVSAENAIDPEKVSAAAEAGALLIEGINKMPKNMSTAGAVEVITSIDIDGFVSGFTKLATGIVNFNAIVTPAEIDSTKISSIISATNAMIEMVKGMVDVKIPDMGYILDNITILGQATTSFYYQTANIDVDTLNARLGLVGSFMDTIKATSDFDIDINVFVDALKTVSENMNKYYNTIVEWDTGKFDAVSNSINQIIAMYNNAEGLDAEKVALLQNAINSLSTLDFVKFNEMAASINMSAAESFALIINTINTTITSGVGTITQSFSDMVTKAIETLTGRNEDFKNVGVGFVEQIKGAFTSYDPTIEMGIFATKLTNSLSVYTTNFFNIGVDFSQGLINGINSKKTEVEQTGTNLASAVASAVQSTLQINSPSKVLYRIGKGVPEGLVKAMVEGQASVEQSGKDMAKVASTSVANLLDGLSYGDTNLIITPILDTTGVDEIKNTLMSLFDTTSLELAAEAGALKRDNSQNEYNKEKTDSSTDASDTPILEVQVPVIVDGRQIAKATAKYTKEELDKIERDNNRKGGRH